jgi:hypothetical protein
MAYEILMYAKFPGKCRDCGLKIEQGAAIKFDMFNKTAKHVKCPEAQRKIQKEDGKNG